MKRFLATILLTATVLVGCSASSNEASAPADMQKLVEAICLTKTDEAEFVAAKLGFTTEQILEFMDVPLDCVEARYLGQLKESDNTTSYAYVFKAADGLEEWWVFQVDNETGVVVDVD